MGGPWALPVSAESGWSLRGCGAVGRLAFEHRRCVSYVSRRSLERALAQPRLSPRRRVGEHLVTLSRPLGTFVSAVEGSVSAIRDSKRSILCEIGRPPHLTGRSPAARL
jgi:hypothetical protein